MAIGDTVNAGLMRVDFSPFLEAGRANAAANASFGQALGQVAKGFIDGQEKKKRSNEIAGFLIGQGVGEKDAMAIAKNPFLQKEYQRKQEAEAKMKMEKERLNAQASMAAQGRAQAQAFRDDENERKDKALAKKQAEEDEIKKQDDIYDQFLKTGGSGLLQTEQGQGLFSSMVEAGLDPSDALKNIQAFEQRIAQSQPKAPTINEQIALEKREEEVEEKAQQKESEEQQRQSLLSETNDILGIIESGKDVTGQVEGLDFVRALKKSVGYGKEDEKLRRKLERYANKFTLENVSKLKGPLSEKELAFIQQSSPKITDEPEVWVDFLTGLKDQLNTEGAGQIPQADPSAPASQSLLDEIERKKQLRSKRAGL